MFPCAAISPESRPLQCYLDWTKLWFLIFWSSPVSRRAAGNNFWFKRVELERDADDFGHEFWVSIFFLGGGGLKPSRNKAETFVEKVRWRNSPANLLKFASPNLKFTLNLLCKSRDQENPGPPNRNEATPKPPFYETAQMHFLSRGVGCLQPNLCKEDSGTVGGVSQMGWKALGGFPTLRGGRGGVGVFLG